MTGCRIGLIGVLGLVSIAIAFAGAGCASKGPVSAGGSAESQRLGAMLARARAALQRRAVSDDNPWGKGLPPPRR